MRTPRAVDPAHTRPRGIAACPRRWYPSGPERSLLPDGRVSRADLHAGSQRLDHAHHVRRGEIARDGDREHRVAHPEMGQHAGIDDDVSDATGEGPGADDYVACPGLVVPPSGTVELCEGVAEVRAVLLPVDSMEPFPWSVGWAPT